MIGTIIQVGIEASHWTAAGGTFGNEQMCADIASTVIPFGYRLWIQI